MSAQKKTERVICVANDIAMSAASYGLRLLSTGSGALDAAMVAVRFVEDDPRENSVGYGGLPNENGVVELDAAVMCGRTGRAGAVGALQRIRHPCDVARLVMESTNHVLLTGAGALAFAKENGFKEENLLTKEAKSAWMSWNAKRSRCRGTETKVGHSAVKRPVWSSGTVNCIALDQARNIAGCVSTSGLSFKKAGRISDAALPGAGLWVDNAVGAAGATGYGEAAILTCASFQVVERMRSGLSPSEACACVCRRIERQALQWKLHDSEGRFRYNVKLHAINSAGDFGGFAIWSGGRFVVAEAGRKPRFVRMEGLYDKTLR